MMTVKGSWIQPDLIFFFFFEINHARSSIDSGNQKNVVNEESRTLVDSNQPFEYNLSAK